MRSDDMLTATGMGWLKGNIIGIGGVVVAAFSIVVSIYAAFARIEAVAVDSQNRIDKIEKKVLEFQEVGGSGMISPTAHSTLDLQITHYMEERLGAEGWRRLQSQFSTKANGGGKTP